MNYIFLNLKRFDVPASCGGVNRQPSLPDWGRWVVEQTQDGLRKYFGLEFIQFLPEAHLIQADQARTEGSPVLLGCQGVCRTDTAPGGNFGALTTGRPASIARELGCSWVIIGHCEERADLKEVLGENGPFDPETVDRLLNREVRRGRCTGAKGAVVHRREQRGAGAMG